MLIQSQTEQNKRNRDRIDSDIDAFLANGGAIEELNSGHIKDKKSSWNTQIKTNVTAHKDKK
jgi:hypothetical protein